MTPAQSVRGLPEAFRELSAQPKTPAKPTLTLQGDDAVNLEKEKLLHDAKCWNHVKNKMYRQMGFSSPIQMQVKVDEDLIKTAQKRKNTWLPT